MDETPPGGLVILLPLTAGMDGDAPTARGTVPMWVANHFFADEVVEGLVGPADAGAPAGRLDVAVIGYRADDDGRPRLTSLLPDGDPAPHFVSLAALAALPAGPRSPGRPRRWTGCPDRGGGSPAAVALAEAYRLVVSWLAGRHAARAPVVVHCTAGAGLDATYARVARSLNLLATAGGPPRLVHCGWAAEGPDAAAPAEGSAAPPDPWQVVRELSAPLPDGRRALTVNEWPTEMVAELLAPGGATAAADIPPAADPFDLTRTFWTPKLGNAAGEWEDAFAVESATGTATVCDGASEGIFCRAWADLLARRATADRPEFAVQGPFARWVTACRQGWLDGINYTQLRWSQQHRVDAIGAAATLLALRVGPAAETGDRPWAAAAVGDACLFWVRDNGLLGTFPVTARDQFGSAPLLVRSDPAYKSAATTAEGVCRPGDLFLLATDAVAGHLFRDPDGPTDWRRFETLAADDWLADMVAVRRGGEMVNDDCTLVVLRVAGPPADGGGPAGSADIPPAGEAVPEAEPFAADEARN